ncbi:hypothetical protein [Pseudobacteriovorax antillogorgiicola]|uniref:Uncharacterized protein n=1 Tax=Pseudobacteriovorax antillogorgiicola TaxID=1513793 RepID=A0A1Y6B6X1_9BACT|nr:hypothetical protein [Pseudobacteriovorax antillogorgiicola]TCS58703.1 hypothetical protein EDD56_102216 [Pseudobacteriovorax antillogorgiicola]SME95612.1 hypothetical protein SAMN06296036_102227 [Pseudobacteriovorax antillogorgiicola]
MARNADQQPGSGRPHLRLIQSDESPKKTGHKPMFKSKLAAELDAFADALDLEIEIIKNS